MKNINRKILIITILSFIITAYSGKTYFSNLNKESSLVDLPALIENHPVIQYNSDSSDATVTAKISYSIPGLSKIKSAVVELDSSYVKIQQGKKILIGFDPDAEEILLRKDLTRSIQIYKYLFLSGLSIFVFCVFFIRRSFKRKKRR